MEPLAVPPATQPLARVDKFVYMWSSHGAAEGCGVGPPYATAGAGGVDVIGSDKGVTVWRPQPPMGYALLGDVLAAGRHRLVCVLGLWTAISAVQGVHVSDNVSPWEQGSCCGVANDGCPRLLLPGLKQNCHSFNPAGHSQPDHQVVAVAINSGLVTYPLGFVRVWESPGAAGTAVLLPFLH